MAWAGKDKITRFDIIKAMDTYDLDQAWQGCTSLVSFDTSGK